MFGVLMVKLAPGAGLATLMVIRLPNSLGTAHPPRFRLHHRRVPVVPLMELVEGRVHDALPGMTERSPHHLTHAWGQGECQPYPQRLADEEPAPPGH